jgi:hypothetical protein
VQLHHKRPESLLDLGLRGSLTKPEHFQRCIDVHVGNIDEGQAANLGITRDSVHLGRVALAKPNGMLRAISLKLVGGVVIASPLAGRVPAGT